MVELSRERLSSGSVEALSRSLPVEPVEFLSSLSSLTPCAWASSSVERSVEVCRGSVEALHCIAAFPPPSSPDQNRMRGRPHLLPFLVNDSSGRRKSTARSNVLEAPRRELSRTESPQISIKYRPIVALLLIENVFDCSYVAPAS